MSAPDTNTDDVEELPERLSDGSTGPALTADGPGEFWCYACGSRCTRNTSEGTEYGHCLDCPERELPDPREDDDWTRGPFSRSVGEGVRQTSQLQNCLAAQDTDDGDDGDRPIVEPPAPQFD
ncbi:hypothetical protein PN415_18370 [Halorubrum ezzemoulense]|uniref:hypothetical protein n=1 Tax=Halorubrum ezzemoulense TaxID=337243 RepID=UPI00232D2C22|nr:hypothetical protein [Halorubrum ezzemoulense]MDB9281787.1 hypothetical protein [Halorubrum ezzemoulense]